LPGPYARSAAAPEPDAGKEKMSTNTELNAQVRSEQGKSFARKLRAGGKIPAVLYGKDMEARSLSLDAHEVETLFRGISVENTILDLVIDGEKAPVQTLIREIQTFPHKPGILHVDFLRIQKGVAVEVDIPISLDGTPIGVREAGGVLEQMINELRVKCIPSKIPEVVSLDVTDLGIGDSFHVSDVELGEGVDVLVDPTRAICNVAVPKVVEVEPEVEEEELEVLEEEAAAEAAPAEEGEVTEDASSEGEE
jgi:large subunit ribosomal protein L25